MERAAAASMRGAPVLAPPTPGEGSGQRWHFAMGWRSLRGSSLYLQGARD
ncbi:hypothetical protein AK812_SmicGene47138, partial [Symbiodinium microadriaticum]